MGIVAWGFYGASWVKPLARNRKQRLREYSIWTGETCLSTANSLELHCQCARRGRLCRGFRLSPEHSPMLRRGPSDPGSPLAGGCESHQKGLRRYRRALPSKHSQGARARCRGSQGGFSLEVAIPIEVDWAVAVGFRPSSHVTALPPCDRHSPLCRATYHLCLTG